jgi:DNA-binding transcriptional MerR regulator
VDPRRLTLDELADACGMTARNIRAYQTRGLLPAPLRHGRRTVYDGRHVERLLAIHRARAAGASLALIASQLARTGNLADPTLGGWLPAPTTVDVTDGERPVPVVDLDLDGDPAGDPGGVDLQALLEHLDGLDHLDGSPAETAAALDLLAEVGVLRRQDGRVLVGGSVAAAITALHQHGVGARTALQVAGLAARAAGLVTQQGRPTATLGDHLTAGLTAALMAQVVREAVTARLTRPV